MSNIFAVIGIGLVLLGTAWTVVATLRAPEWLQYPEFQYGAEHVIRSTDKARRTGWENFPPEERDAELQRAAVAKEKDLEDLAARTGEQFRRHRAAISKGSLFGLGLIALGSVAQGIAIILTSAPS